MRMLTVYDMFLGSGISNTIQSQSDYNAAMASVAPQSTPIKASSHLATSPAPIITDIDTYPTWAHQTREIFIMADCCRKPPPLKQLVRPPVLFIHDLVAQVSCDNYELIRVYACDVWCYVVMFQ